MSSAGADGPLVLERRPATNPLFTAFFAAVQEAGYRLTSDVNGYRRRGSRPSIGTSAGPAVQCGPCLPAPGHAQAQPHGCAKCAWTLQKAAKNSGLAPRWHSD